MILRRIYVLTLIIIVLTVIILLLQRGYDFYNIPLEERFFHVDYQTLKPSGTIGHGLGIFGSILILLGVSLYLLRKRWRKISRLGFLKHWLEFHIFLCTLGPILILFHTSFKFDGLVVVSFWSMVAVFLSGIIGRYIYIQIPHTIEGNEMTLNEIRNEKNEFGEKLKHFGHLSQESLDIILETTRNKVEISEGNWFKIFLKNWANDRHSIILIRRELISNSVSRKDVKAILKLAKSTITLNRKIERLQNMQKIFRYWHVAHLPFAFVMLIIMIIHVIVTLLFGYRWIF